MNSVRFYKGYHWAAFFLLVIFLLFQHVAAADSTQVYLDYEIWRGDISDRVYDLAISDDGKYIASGSRDGTVRLIDQSGKLLWAYNNMKVNGLLPNPDYGGDYWALVAISSEGEYIAAGIWDNSGSRVRSPKILFFDRTGNLLWTAPAKNVADVAITPDGNNIAVSADGSAFLFNKEGSIVWEYGNLGLGDSISVSDDGSVVAWKGGGSGDYTVVSLFDSSGSLVWEKPVGIDYGGLGHEKGQYQQMSADGSVILVVQYGHDSGSADLFGKDGGQLWSLKEPNTVISGKMSSNGEYSVLGIGEGVSLVNRQGNVIWTENFGVNSSDIRSSANYIVDISRDGSLVAAAATGIGVRRDTLTLMTKTGKILWTTKISDRPERLVMSADGEYIATASGSTLYLFKKDRNSNNPPYTTDLKSNIRYDTESYVGEYIFTKYLTTANLVIGAIVIGLLIAIGYGIWHIKKHVRKKT